jgi:hypothetical protein
MNWINLYDVLQWLMTAGAGVCSWGLLDVAERRGWLPGLATMDFEAKRWTALGVAAALTLAAWGLSMLFFYVAPPTSWRSGVEEAVRQLLVSLPIAFTASQIAHARAQTIRGVEMAPRG